MTIADLLQRMELLDNELETGSGEANEATAIVALDTAQDFFETLAACYPNVLGTTGTVTTTASTETTAYPTGVLRLDSIWYLDATTSRPTRLLDRIYETGGHAPSLPWPLRASLQPASGIPDCYWTDEEYLYWRPLPDATHTLRWYGFKAATNLAARTETFGYKDYLALPFAAFACRILAIGVADNEEELKALATELFTPALRKLRRFSRERPSGRVYSTIHTA